MTSPRKAFTLVELLVVASLMAVLFGLIVANGRPRPSALRGAQDFSSALLAAQSRSLGKPEGAAVIIESDGTVFYEADMLPPLMLPVNAGTLQAHADLPSSYKCRFRQKVGDGFVAVSPWLGLNNGAPVLRDLAGQTPANTILEPPGAEIEAMVIRSPRLGSNPIKVGRGVQLFLEHSGVGDNLLASHGYGRFSGQGRIAIVFDQTGRVAEVIRQLGAAGAPEPLAPNEIIYFLFGEAGESEPLSGERSVWVAVNPQTGRINVASNEPSADLVVARSKARQAIAFGK
jgi:prepilin-type N-terminal cleavage/methylation domain-containing protein